MKHFKLHGNTAYWKHGLNLDVLNLNTLENDVISPIPSDKRMWVNVVSNLYKTEDEEREVLKGEISESDKNALLSRIKSNTPDFIISLGGKVVGYANLHQRKGCAVPTDTEETNSQKAQVNISDIVGDNLSLLVVLAPKTTEEDIAALAELREKLSEDATERIVIISHDEHRLYVEDISVKLLNEKYNGEEEDYIADNYPFLGDYSWDYIVDAEYTPKDGAPIDIDFAELV